MAARENKLKAFFRARSRSRSRSQPDPPPMPSGPDPDPDPGPDPRHAQNPPLSYARSSVRPVSSTTTATHSTITPLPSDVLRSRMHRGRRAYPYHPQSTDTRTSVQDHDPCSDSCEYDSDDPHPPRSDTPSSSTRKLALHSIFGISLTRRSSSTVSTPQQSISTSERNGSASTSASEPKTKSSSKRSFRLTSRPSTPKSVDDSKSPFSIPVPSSPLPLSASPRRRSFGLGGSQRSTPKSSTGYLPLPHVHSAQAGRSHARRHSLGSDRPPHDSAVALPEESSHRSTDKANHLLPVGGARNKAKERERLFSGSEKPLPDIRPSDNFTSQSLPDPSPISRNYPSSQFAGRPVFPLLSTVDSASSEENERPSLLAPHVIPRIIHTPPTPQRPGEVDSPSRPSTSLPRTDPGGKAPNSKNKTVTIAHREQLLVSASADVQPTSHKGRFAPRFLNDKDLPKTNGQKSSKQLATGPLDGPIYKTPVSNITGPVRNMTSHRSKLGSFDFERPISALNRSGTTMERQEMQIPKDNSSYIKSSLQSLQRTISNDSARGTKSRLIAQHPGQAEFMLSQVEPDHASDTPILSFSSISLQTKSTGKGTGSTTPAGQSSSWGRASGRHVLRTSHGTFAFENPSSVPSSPNPQTFNLLNGPNQNDLSESVPGLTQSQPTSLSSNVFVTRVKHSRGQSYNTSDYVDTGHPRPDERKPKGKGRSLDLGLKLSWAPSSLREEVLMPGLILSREKAKREKKKANGLDVTKVFESILSESRFQAFKKYVHRFDAHIISLEGSCGLLARVEKLLVESGVSEQERETLMSEFTTFVKNHSE